MADVARCPYCRGEILEPEAREGNDVAPQDAGWVTCEACGVRHHEVCWRLNQLCGVCRTSRYLPGPRALNGPDQTADIERAQKEGPPGAVADGCFNIGAWTCGVIAVLGVAFLAYVWYSLKNAHWRL
jgi:hypothetical protein